MGAPTRWTCGRLLGTCVGLEDGVGGGVVTRATRPVSANLAWKEGRKGPA